MDNARVLVVGAGGHARVCLDALSCDRSVTVVGCTSADESSVDDLGVPLLGLDSDPTLVGTHRLTHFLVAIGANRLREELTQRMLDWGLIPVVARSRSAIVSPSACIGEGSLLAPGAIVNAHSTVGPGCIVNTNVSVDHDCTIGAFTHVAPGAVLAGTVTVGVRVLIGLGARVLPGLSIGDDAVVGAGAVVLSSVPAGATVAGVPALLLPSHP